MLIPSRSAMHEAFVHTLPYYEALGVPIPEDADIASFIEERSVNVYSVREKIFDF